jgi:parallel beta-helix repeat protein
MEDSLRVNNGDANHYRELISFVSQHDMSQPEHFDAAAQMIDMDEFINYMSYKIYGGYIQWQVNNKYWRERTRGSTWRWIAFDMEHCFAGPGSDTYDGNTLLSTLEPDNESKEYPTLLFRKLMENENFRALFIQRSALFMNTVFREERLLGIIDSLKLGIGNEIEDHINRWDSPVSLSAWNHNIEILKEFASNRNDFMFRHLMDYFNIPDTSLLTILCSPGGKVVVCSSFVLEEDSASLTLFNQVPVSLVAMPRPGYRFSGWNGLNPDPNVDLVFSNDTLVHALFERTSRNLLPDTVRGHLVLDDILQPYYASGSVVIPPGDSLTILEGVQVLMPPHSSLVNYGSLRILGTKNHPVLINVNTHITGAYFTSGTRKWDGVTIHSPDTTRISHTVLKNSSSGLRADHSIISLTGVRIHGPPKPVYCYKSQVLIDSCSLSSNGTGDLINLRACINPRIRNNDLKGNFFEDTDAIDLDSVQHAVIEGNYIYSFFGLNSDGIDLGEGSTNILIQNNRIFSCSDKGISVGQSSEAHATNNLIVDCNQGFGIKDSGSYAYIYQNTLHNNGTGIACFEKNAGKGGGSALVLNSIISNPVDQSVFVDEFSSLTISYCLSDRDILPGSNNLLDSPLFAGASYHNFYLSEGSPCIDRGSPEQQDPDGTRADVGAFIALNEPDIHGVLINEINFNGHDSFDPGDWIELYNPSDQAIDLGGWYLKGENPGDEYAFSHMLMLQPGAYLVIAEHMDSMSLMHGSGPDPEGNLNFGLNRDGEVIKLYNQAYQLVHSFQYGNEHPWPNGPDGKGATMELHIGESDNSNPGKWHASHILGGTPGSRNSEATPLSGLYINEFMAKNDDAFPDAYGEYDDWIEVYNANDFPVYLGGINFMTNSPDKRLWMVPLYDEAATLIEAKDFKLFWADKDPEQGILHLDFNLKASGGSIALAQVVKQQIHEIDLVYYDNQPSDIAFGRYPDGGSLLSVLFPTPGSSNIMTGLPGAGDDPARLQVYPNPADQFVNIEIKQLDRPAFGELMNITGQIINQFQIMPGEQVRIDVRGIPTGIYFIRISATSALSAKILIY